MDDVVDHWIQESKNKFNTSDTKIRLVAIDFINGFDSAIVNSIFKRLQVLNLNPVMKQTDHSASVYFRLSHE
jgi:hypothetical protein